MSGDGPAEGGNAFVRVAEPEAVVGSRARSSAFSASRSSPSQPLPPILHEPPPIARALAKRHTAVAVEDIPAPTLARFDCVEAWPLTATAWLQRLVQDVDRRRRGLQGLRTATSLNAATVSRARREVTFRAALAAFDYVDIDGMSLVYWSHLTHGPAAPERVATTDFIHAAARLCAERGISFFLLGATEESNRAAAARLKELYPDLIIAGRHHGYFQPDEAEAVIAEINASGADIIWVALGVPKEQAFILEHRAAFTNAAWIKSCGGCFDFLSGSVVRAPAWMQRVGLEWLFRVLQEPRRLIWRYATTNPHAFALMLRQLWREMIVRATHRDG